MNIRPRSHLIAGTIALAAILDVAWGWLPQGGHSTARPEALPAANATAVVPRREVAPAAERPVARARAHRAPTRAGAVAPPMRHATIATLDPETGRLATDPVPVATEGEGDPRLVAAARSRPVVHPDGSISMDVRGWMRENFVVRIGPDGQPYPLCLDGHEATQRALAAPPRPALEEE
jgi:hypothetical protein